MSGRRGNWIENPARYEEAIQERIKANARQSRVRKFHEATPDWEAIQNFIYSKRGNFFDSLANSLNEWGALSVKQVEAVRKIMAQDQEPARLSGLLATPLPSGSVSWATRSPSKRWSRPRSGVRVTLVATTSPSSGLLRATSSSTVARPLPSAEGIRSRSPAR